ncbi:class II aldolase/adducin family protein [Actinomycetospora termitidis]|uniref:Class II aldolase/adducin family protein n=1 Tax=Actinomycetospora termitidis TaxID=3053470 RepID=A0ABT7MEI7_9PSEU|nr:class II aldolase/adducin family protein [Actinomycetospora sp. Odt1-22]MDL5159065.1 class II aldolase/adducin family protein [Actinomycetospora sp. Odt1-22]
MTDDIRELVSLASRVLGAADQGDFIWGHASARDPDGRGAWIKRSGIGLSEVGPEQVHLVSPDGEVLSGDGPRHLEFPIHTEILLARPDVGGVVHAHSPHAVALAAAGVELRPVSHAATFFVPPSVPRFTETTDLVLTRDLGRSLAKTLGDSSGAFLVNHGIVTVGPDLQTATFAALLLETAAEQMLRTLSFGGHPTWTDDEESLVKREHIYHPAAVHSAWDHLVRRLGG